MKPLVIYHAQCADGFGAAFAAWLKFGDEAEYLPMQYGKDFLANAATPLIGREIYILDFSIPREQMDYLFANAKRVVWLDHHKTAFEMWCGKFEKGMSFINSLDDLHRVHLSDNKSGAYLAWEWFHGTEIPMLIQHIDDYDRWQFKIEGTKAFNKALWSYTPWSFEQWKEMFWNEAHHEDFSIEATGLIEEGNAILRAHEQNVQSVVKGGARKCTIPFNEEAALDCVEPCLEWNDDGYWMVQGLAANCPPHLTSDVGHELANQSGTFGLLWTLNKDNVCECSLRSNGDYDVSAIAKAFGGGGHRNAAGFTIDIQTLLGWLK